MNKKTVKIIGVIVFYIQLYITLRFGPVLMKWIKPVVDWQAFNIWLNSSLEIQMFFGIPLAIIGTFLGLAIILFMFYYPQHLLEKLEN